MISYTNTNEQLEAFTRTLMDSAVEVWSLGVIDVMKTIMNNTAYMNTTLTPAEGCYVKNLTEWNGSVALHQSM